MQKTVENEKSLVSITLTRLFALVRSPGLEPGRLPIRPSNVRVCLFRHDRTKRRKTDGSIILAHHAALCKRECGKNSICLLPENLAGAAHPVDDRHMEGAVSLTAAAFDAIAGVGAQRAVVPGRCRRRLAAAKQIGRASCRERV